MTSYTSAFDSGFLARFTATIAATVPTFDLDDTPIGHALAAEFFAEPEAEPEAGPVAEPEVEPEQHPLVLEPERVYEWPTATARPKQAVVVELPVPADPTSAEEWFGATTEPDEDAPEIDFGIEEPVRRAS